MPNRIKKLRIAIVCFPTIGGSGAVATELGMELATRGHQIHFIAHDLLFRLSNTFNRNLNFHLVESVDSPLFEDAPIYVLLLVNKIAEVCRRYNIDIIHTHYAVPHAAAAIMARNMPGTKARVINTFHGTDVSLLANNLNLSEVMVSSINQCDGLTAVAKALGQQAVESYQIQKSLKVHTIYNFAKMQKYPPAKARELHDLFSQQDEKIISHISNFREIKRIQDVVEIYRGIDSKVPSKLLLIGDGPEQRVAYRLISKYQLHNKVHILGIQANISRILSITDLFLLPSGTEAFSLAALEAMSFGIPVIATDVGGMSEMISDGESGFLSDVGDVPSMIAKGVAVLSDAKLYQKIKQNTVAKIQNQYNPDVIVPQYEQYYHEILAKN